MNLQNIKLKIKNNRTAYIAGTAAVICIIVIYMVVRSFSRVSTDDAYLEGRIHTIAAKIPGTVENVNITDNQYIKKGDLLVEIDANDYKLRTQLAIAALEAEKAKLLNAEAEIKTMAANIEVQEAAFNQAGLDRQRAETLYPKNAMPKDQYDKFITAYNMAAAQLKMAREQLEKAKAMKILQEALVKQAQVALNTATLNLGYTKIYAPADGYITKKSVEQGNQIQPAQPIMAVVDLNDVWIIANYKETQMKNVKSGQRVKIKVDTYPDIHFTGKVDSIMAGTGAVFSMFPPENALGNYVKVVQRVPVKIVLDKNSIDLHILRIGMSCVPTIITKDD